MKAVYNCLVLLASLAACHGSPWLFQASHSRVVPDLTDDVTLQCFYNGSAGSGIVPGGLYKPDDVTDVSPGHGNVTFGPGGSHHPTTSQKSPRFGDLTRIRILKLDATKTWRTFAKVISEEPSKVTLADVRFSEYITTSGYIGSVNESALSIKWSTATLDTLGSYRCEVNGFTSALENSIQFSSQVENITFPYVTVNDLFESAKAMKKRIHRLEKGIANQVQTQIEENFVEARYWPAGSYSLLSPWAGCPSTAYSHLRDGYARIDTDDSTTTPRHNLSSPTHLNLEVCKNCGRRSSLQLKFCSNSGTDFARTWPKGSYCIHAVGSSCPSGFTYGYTRLYLNGGISSTSVTQNINSAMVIQRGYGYVEFYFCCRSDGDASVPILLPNDKGFYLYRYKGQCQRVANTHVTGEWIEMDSGDVNKDVFGNTYHADGTINKGRLELCYYTHAHGNGSRGTP